MNNQKRENLLNLALDASEEEREKSLNLSVGYEPEDKTWEVIVKYSGDIQALAERYPDILITELSNEYAIIVLSEAMLQVLSNQREIEYIEKPKRLYFAVRQGIRASCITPLYEGSFQLTGENVITAFIDSGIDYLHPDFRNEDGTTRITSLWDQTIQGVPPEGFHLGTEYTKAQIDEALAQPTLADTYRICPSRDLSGHGTHVDVRKNKYNKGR